jgi:hypothetical protein
VCKRRPCFVVSGPPYGVHNTDYLDNDRAARQVDPRPPVCRRAPPRSGSRCPGRRRRFGRRAGPATKGVIPIAPPLLAEIKYFGRYKGGAIRDGVIMAIGDINAAPVMGTWSCDSDEAVAAFDLRS